MPTIYEDEEHDVPSSLPTPDFSELLSLPEPAFATDELPVATTVGSQPLVSYHVDAVDSMFHDLAEDWDIAAPSADSLFGLEEPDYAKFENWIPQFIRPERPCEYCRIKRLNCYITRGETACTPCSSLFRDCSLTDTHYLERANQATGHLLDTLHVVDEDLVTEHGSRTGIKGLRSQAHASGTSTPRLDDAQGSSKRNGIRFPRFAVKVLRDWLDAHASNPYPTEDEKAALEKQTELKPSQIANWLANARRRRKATDKARPRLCLSPSLKPSTPAIDIPQPDKPWDELNPFERWKHSPPENEPASMRDIANAVASQELGEEDHLSTSPSSAGRRKKRSSNGSVLSNIRAPSTGSLDTPQSSSLSASNSAVYSHHSSQSHGSFGSFNSSLVGKRDRRRRRKVVSAPIRRPGDEKRRIFQCTFCTDTFKSKYDWTRHEKSLHLSLEKWVCAPLGPVITDPATANKRCVYCDQLDPTHDHLDTHNHQQCEEKGLDSRTFYRKDHLRQHMRLMHNCEMTSSMDTWKSIAVNINSRCGFCEQRFTVWQDRVDHLTVHFKAGARMSEWKGCRGLDPAVAAQVTNAMPPYLIGIESVSPNPFSASNRGTWRQNYLSDSEAAAETSETILNRTNPPQEPHQSELAGLGSKTTCWEMLTVGLGKYANEMAKKGVVLTDEMLQTQARRILYDSDDSWNQTAADSPEWLDLFKKAHGLDFIPSKIGGQGAQVPEDLETYGDLGLRIPFAVQLQAYNQRTDDESRKDSQCFCTTVPGAHTKDSHEKALAQVRSIYHILASEGVLHDANGKCMHIECSGNILRMVETTDGSGGTGGATKYRWCTYELPPQKAKEIADLAAKKAYLPRYKLELPPDRAREFQTVTGAWEASGVMPESIFTASATLPGSHTAVTTGAMMEFLGGTVGSSLPFATDAATAAIQQLVDGSSWTFPTAAQEAVMLEEIDRIVAERDSSDSIPRAVQQPPTSDLEEFPFATATTIDCSEDFANDLSMDGLRFDDLDASFDDGVFDMTIDDGFDFGSS